MPGSNSSLKCLLETHPAFEEMLKTRGVHGGHHGTDHDLLVASLCLFIVTKRDVRSGELAALAALLHSFDRHLLQTEQDVDPIARKLLLQDTLAPYIKALSLDSEEELLVWDAIMGHDQPNQVKDSLVSAVLKDADRLANLHLTATIRVGQHRADAATTLFTSNVFSPHVESTYHEQRCATDALLYMLEWVFGEKFWLSLPKRAQYNTYALWRKECRSVLRQRTTYGWLRIARGKKLGKVLGLQMAELYFQQQQSAERLGILSSAKALFGAEIT